MATKCLDISNWQGVVSKDTFIKNKSKIPFVILRCSYTSFSGKFQMYEDKAFEKNFVHAYKAGLRVGVYHYSQARTESEARKEALFAIGIVQRVERKYGITLSLFFAFDYEFGGRLTSSYAWSIGKQRCKQICDSFCRKVRASGYHACVYANLSMLTSYLPSDLYHYWDIWVAQYNNRCDYKHPYICWQFTSSGHVDGISGRVDLNWYYGQESISKPSNAQKYPYELPKLPSRGWFSSGDTGEEVKKLQHFLKWYLASNLKVDGVVGRKTIEAVEKYQGREGLRVDGCFGKKSLERAKVVKR